MAHLCQYFVFFKHVKKIHLRHIQLSEADSELRGIIQSNSPIVLCSTHHSFKTQMRRDDAIVAVNSTIKELVKKIVVHEVRWEGL